MEECECLRLFNDFCWADLSTLKKQDLPIETGVYSIRYREKGLPISKTIEFSNDYFDRSNWYGFLNYYHRRIDRLSKIGECPIIYIGAASSERKGFQSRYTDLCGLRHTVFIQ